MLTKPAMLSPITRDEWLGHGAMALFAILVAGSFSLGGMSANLIDPAAITAVRFALAAIIIGAIVAIGPGLKRRDLRAPWRYGAMGLCMAIYFVLMFEGLKTASPVSTSAVFTLTPILSGIFGWFLLRQIMRPIMAFWLLVGAIGAIWVIFRADLAALVALDVGIGEAIFFLGCMAHALYTPLIRKLNKGEHPLVFTFGMLVSASILTLIWSAQELIATPWSDLPGIVWITLFYLTVFATSSTFFLLQFASLRLPSSKVMAYTYFTPVVVILWEGALGHGWPTPTILLGISLIVASLVGLLRA